MSSPSSATLTKANTSTHRTVPIGFTAGSRRDSQYEDLKTHLTSFDEVRLKRELVERRRGAYKSPAIIIVPPSDNSFDITGSPVLNPQQSSEELKRMEGLEMSPKSSPKGSSGPSVSVNTSLLNSDEANTSQLLRDLESAYAEHHLNEGDSEGQGFDYHPASQANTRTSVNLNLFGGMKRISMETHPVKIFGIGVFLAVTFVLIFVGVLKLLIWL
ncbi:hypothetical protein TrVE_jg14296 [Triparma verrucosa]|uniref:Uncharacterized protein n=1 Tax=Triparma verrucosa TaxID=1606542 RepID=A0A9W7C0M6_9STRA|nr:hypothetical protein TrVE_jg14296 [Triparma verrucosa]